MGGLNVDRNIFLDTLWQRGLRFPNARLAKKKLKWPSWQILDWESL